MPITIIFTNWQIRGRQNHNCNRIQTNTLVISCHKKTHNAHQCGLWLNLYTGSDFISKEYLMFKAMTYYVEAMSQRAI